MDSLPQELRRDFACTMNKGLFSKVLSCRHWQLRGVWSILYCINPQYSTTDVHCTLAVFEIHVKKEE
jgi:hypothetical protein